MWTRRRLLHTLPGLVGATLAWPRVARAATGPERRFLFLFAQGGWDQTMVFAPLFDNPYVEMEDDAEVAQVNGLTFVDSPERPAVRLFFEDFGDQVAMINGLEARSVAHDTCLRLVMTGSQSANADDWSASIAAHSQRSPLMPMVHMSGPSYSFQHGSSIVRVGQANQLPKLLDGSALDESDMIVPAPAADIEALQDQYAATVAHERNKAALRGRNLELLARGLEAEERLALLQEVADELDLGSGDSLTDRSRILIRAFEQDLSRCAMLGHEGAMGLSWDTHAANTDQIIHYQELFTTLSDVMGNLRDTPAPEGGVLADTTTVVVLSEMGRYPQFNGRAGKEHWTFTSALIMGAGVRGGQVVGGYDDAAAGQQVDLASGEPHDSGEFLVPDHIGATLYRLAGMDSEALLPGVSPISAVLEDR